MFLKLMLTIIEVLSNVLVSISWVGALNWSDTIYPNLEYPRQNGENRHINVMVLISQVTALKWSGTIYPNLGYPVKNAESRHFCQKSYMNVLCLLVMFLKLMLRIVEVLIKLLVLIRQVAALNWSDTIYPNIGYFVKSTENRHFCKKRDLKVLQTMVIFQKLMLRIVKVLTNVLILISQVAALNWSDNIYPNFANPHKKRWKSTKFCHESDLNVFYALVMFLRSLATFWY